VGRFTESLGTFPSIPSKLEVVPIKLPDTWLGKANFVKFEGGSLNYHECRLDYILISIKCEIFV
jgi:hypothetical protein